jgi:hypothetical protein
VTHHTRTDTHGEGANVAELITLTDDIEGHSVTGARRIKFAVNGKPYEIDLAEENEERLRAEFDVFGETVKVVGTIDGDDFTAELTYDQAEKLRSQFGVFGESVTVTAELDGDEYAAALPPGRAEDFIDAMSYWVGHARKLGKAAARMVAGGSVGPRIEIGTDYCATPPDVSHASALGKEYKALRQTIRAWGLANGWSLGGRGVLPKELKEAYALHSHHKPWQHLRPDADEHDDGEEEAALMPAPKATKPVERKGQAK